MKVTVTNAGFAALPSAAGGVNEVRLEKVALGHGQAANDPATTALEHEDVRLATISGQAVSDRVVHLVARDESSAEYTVREFGLYTDAGELFAVYSQADPIIDKSANSTLLLVIDIDFDNIDASSLTFGDITFTNPPWSESVKGVLKKASKALAQGMADNATGMTPKRTADAIAKWLNASKPGPGGGLDADTLDGQHGSYYRNASNQNAGTTPRARLPHATETDWGATRYASKAQAESGSNNDLGMTPRRVRDLVKVMLDDQRNKDWPVGSLYFNRVSSTNPGSFLPGTWVKVEEGYLYPHGAPGAGSAGHVFGENEHTLKPSEVPKLTGDTNKTGSHKHGGSTNNAGSHHHSYNSGHFSDPFGGGHESGASFEKSKNTSNAGNHKHSFTTNSAGSHKHNVTVNAGGGAAHNNMPLSVVVYVWRRTA